jgi:hypothetical protein
LRLSQRIPDRQKRPSGNPFQLPFRSPVTTRGGPVGPCAWYETISGLSSSFLLLLYKR